MNRQDFSTLSPDCKLTINCCQSEVDTAAVETALSSFSDENYQNILRLSQQHGIYPLLYKTIRSVNPASLSLKTDELFKQNNMTIAQQNMLMSAELLQLMQLFNVNSVDAMAFKGPVLGELAYGSVALRQYGDLDILIKKNDIEKTLSLLLQRGYTPEIELEKSTLKTFYSCVNVIGLQRGSVRVEIHWELLSKNYAIEWEEEKLWRESESVEINRKPVRTLSFENHILYLCAHGSKHLFERLEWICDIERAIRAQESIDWEHLLLEAQSLGIERMLLFGVHLSQLFFGLPLPQKILDKIDNDPEIEHLTEKVVTLHYSEKKGSRSYSTFWLLWQMREKLKDRLRFAYRGLFAPKFDDFKFIQLSKQLSFLYPLIRPYRLVTKYFRN
ncbi:MAG: nucleotidyltransferase family protein [Campylobacterota bacterium]